MVTSIKGFLFRTGLSSSVLRLYSDSGASEPGCGDTKFLGLHSRPAASYSVAPSCHVGQPLFLLLYIHTALCGVRDYHYSHLTDRPWRKASFVIPRLWIICLASWNLSSFICKIDLQVLGYSSTSPFSSWPAFSHWVILVSFQSCIRADDSRSSVQLSPLIAGV